MEQERQAGNDHEEILRLRDRQHKANSTLQAHGYRLTSLENFRKEYKGKVDGLMSEAQIEEAVKSALQNQRHNLFSIPQKLGGMIVVICAVASVLIQAVK